MAATVQGSYGTIRSTIRHILRAEADYISRITGKRLEPTFKWEEAPAIEEISQFADQVASALLTTFSQITPTQLVHEEENGFFMDYQARFLCLQVIDHGIEHRTNITTILSNRGFPSPEIDGWAYLNSHAERFELKEGKL